MMLLRKYLITMQCKKQHFMSNISVVLYAGKGIQKS